MSVRSRLRKILIANRGEIACRIIRTAKKLGIKTVAVYSDVDEESLHVDMADEAYHIGGCAAQDSYLKGDYIIEVARKSGATAIHPGYGFLSENAEFAMACGNSGLTFIGPPASAIRDMGIKSTSKKLIGDAGVRIVPGYHGSEQDDSKLQTEAENIGFPVMIKAVRGGGGKGMRIAMKRDEFMSALQAARRESLNAFGDDAVLLERYIERPRHVEVQVFGDKHGNFVHLFERDCSIQRRHQKIIEQSPAPHISNEIRHQLGEAACKVARTVDYVGAGTVEFILDTSDSSFYFMEMNTRLQVEHPVTEMVTGVDLVEWQLLVAAEEPIPLKQEDITFAGYAVEARVYAEGNNFLPTAGKIQAISFPKGENIRVETGVRDGDEVTVHYDPMIAKLIVWDTNEKEVFSKLERALRRFNILGVENNVSFLQSLSRNTNLIDGNVHTNFIEENKENLLPSHPSHKVVIEAVMARILYDEFLLRKLAAKRCGNKSPFLDLGPFRLNNSFKRTYNFQCNNFDIAVEAMFDNKEWYTLSMKEQKKIKVKGSLTQQGQFFNMKLSSSSSSYSQRIGFSGDTVYVFDDSGHFKMRLLRDDYWKIQEDIKVSSSNNPVSPIPGIIDKINIKSGDMVKKGDSIAIVIAMKMEYAIKAEKEGRVSTVMFKPGDNIAKDAPIAIIEQLEW